MMKIVFVTGSAGLIGSGSVRFFINRGFPVIGFDNNMRQTFFGQEASTDWIRDQLVKEYAPHYQHLNLDLRDQPAVDPPFNEFREDIGLVIHEAAQPSHDWAATDSGRGEVYPCRRQKYRRSSSLGTPTRFNH